MSSLLSHAPTSTVPSFAGERPPIATRMQTDHKITDVSELPKPHYKSSLSSSPEDSFGSRKEGTSHLRQLNGVNNSYSISKLLEKKEPSSSRARFVSCLQKTSPLQYVEDLKASSNNERDYMKSNSLFKFNKE
uniref:Uncharacterized protein n=1 Tax=Ascaris lumbricoides TaxID=6252 RepID=A0A0M3IDI2_ASCLU